ncbi:hypothetical protein [Streptomyces sp. NPDC018045]|uniref:hypothetical protein n=1 Tax=Streptomyces sp. NPDC018045 TaxID=3365037 RepID=UPI00378909A7
MSVRDDDMREVYAASSDAIVQVLQLVVTLAAIMAEDRARQREEMYRRELEAEASKARAEAERLRAERAAAEPLLRAAHQERFWKDLALHPERLGRTWQAAAEWAGGDPYAAHTLQHLKEQLADRYGLTVPDWPVGGGDLARLVTLVDPAYRKRLEAARQAAEQAPETSYAVLIRDAQNEGRILYRGEGAAEAGVSAETFAAQQYETWQQQAGAETTRGRAAGEFVVEVVENTGQADAGHVPAATVNAADIPAVLEADRRRLEEVAAGTAQPETHAEHLRALQAVLEKMEADENRRVQRYQEYATKLQDTDLSAADAKRLTSNLAHIQEGLEKLRQQQVDAALQMAAVAAEMHGENPRHVYDAARLSESLDTEWWRTASAREIAGVWDHVAQWEPGAARAETQASIRDEVERRFHMAIPQDAAAETVAAIIGGLKEAGRPVPLGEAGEKLRMEAQDLFEAAYDDLSAARDLESRPDSEHADAERQRAAQLREQADTGIVRGRLLIEQATWVEGQAPETLARVYAENSGAAVEELRAEFARRWGQEAPPAAAETIEHLAAAPAEERVWKVLATEGSTDLAAVPAAVPVQAERAAEAPRREATDTPARAGSEAAYQEPDNVLDLTDELEPSDPEVPYRSPMDDDVVGERAQQEEQRRREAAEAREALEDREAADAVRLAEMSYPDGPEAAVAQPPAARASRSVSGPGADRQREATLEL